jgi:hypothetical protein
MLARFERIDAFQTEAKSAISDILADLGRSLYELEEEGVPLPQ